MCMLTEAITPSDIRTHQRIRVCRWQWRVIIARGGLLRAEADTAAGNVSSWASHSSRYFGQRHRQPA